MYVTCSWSALPGGGLVVEPALGVAQVAAAEQVAAVPVVAEPLAGALGQPRVLLDPRLVELESRDERRDARVEVVLRTRVDPVRPLERRRYRQPVTGRRRTGRSACSAPPRARSSSPQTVEASESGVRRTRSPSRLDPRPDVARQSDGASADVLDVDPDVLAARDERLRQPPRRSPCPHARRRGTVGPIPSGT